MENNHKFIVYCTTNLINNKIYIGVHETKDPNVFDNYIGNGIYINQPSTYQYSKTKFQNAVKKYGVSNFRRTTLAVFDNSEDAYDLEALIVNEEFLTRTDVYNMILGGGITPDTSKVCFQYDSEGNFIKEFKSITQAAESINRHMIGIQRSLKNKTKCAGYFWTEVKYDKLDLTKMHIYDKDLRKIPVFQYSNLGEYECCYNSIRDAARILQIDHSNLSTSIKLGTLCSNKYFSTEFASNYSIAKSETINSKEVHQYTLDGIYIASYENMTKAKKATGIKSDIYKAIKLGRTAGNYQWSFEKLPKIAQIKPKPSKARKVGKYDELGTLLKVYNSKAQCEKENGRGVSHVLYGRDTTHKGFYYKFID